jgi:SAM-dependent methyltransferase
LFSRDLIAASGYDREGFAARYDRFRPQPPQVLLDVLCRYARTERPARVVDLGCGTGLSTRAWSGRGERIIGVEPNPAMLAAAGPAPGVEYREAFGHETGLEDACTDVVTCSQSFHWMEPGPTLAEAARILRRGGVFAAYDYDWPPVVDPELDAAYAEYQQRRAGFRKRHRIERGGDRWPKHEHLERMRASGHFTFCREILLHSEEPGDAERVVGFTRSLGLPVVELTYEDADDELGVNELGEVARRVLGARTVPFVFGYRVRVGVK